MNLSILNTVAICIMDIKILACVGKDVTLIKTNFFCRLSLLSLKYLYFLQTELLLDKGCNSWTTNKNGESALDLACRFGHVHVCIFTNLIPDEI